MSDETKYTDLQPASFFDETITANITVRLFGRDFLGLTLTPEGLDKARSSKTSQNPLVQQLDPKLEPHLARIYGFSYQGNYYKLPAATVLLVHGAGAPVPPSIDPVRLGVGGVEFKDETFASEVKMWGYDKFDFSIRIDITTGWLTDILLAEDMTNENNVTGGPVPDESDQPSRSALALRSTVATRPRR